MARAIRCQIFDTFFLWLIFIKKYVFDMKKIIRLTESDLHEIIRSSAESVLSEMDWKTYMNASKRRKLQGDELRANFPRNSLLHGRNSYDDKADELQKHAQTMFNRKHGKDGYPYQWEGSPDYKGRYTRGQFYDDDDFETKAPTKKGWWRGEKADGIRHYRRGEGFPFRSGGRIHDDQYDYAYGNEKDAWSGDFNGHRTDVIDGDGTRFDPNLSSNSEYMSDYQDKEYMNGLDGMRKDMEDYYSGKSKYSDGKWSR